MKLLVVVPYRDRQAHLVDLMGHLPRVLSEQSIEHSIVVVEQAVGKPFNRGMLCNIGFDLFSDGHDCVCFHDVDMICEEMDYACVSTPTCLVSSRTKNNIYENYFGGVTSFSNEDFRKVNGFSNGYWGWGCEDDDLFKRCRASGLAVVRGRGRCVDLELVSNAHNAKTNNNYESNKRRLCSFSSSFRNDGLSDVRGLYDVVDVREERGYKTVRVSV